ncbi:hypothetical protein AMECASPLE_016279 [Ameca splendens]|uniref:Uncharacterized protein n=1 Tax=Ameca splendens TaxID=208324 RepID=A0ABV0ZMK4_9TELE
MWSRWRVLKYKSAYFPYVTRNALGLITYRRKATSSDKASTFQECRFHIKSLSVTSVDKLEQRTSKQNSQIDIFIFH